MVDVDQREGGRVDDMAAEVIERLAPRSPRWLPRAKAAGTFGTSPATPQDRQWSGLADGDIRGCNGYAILWAPDLVAEGLACAAPVADLMAVDLARLPSKRNGGVVGERNNTLNQGVYLATCNGSPIEPHVAAARAAGLPDPEIAATVASATAAGKRRGAGTLVTNARSPDGWPTV